MTPFQKTDWFLAAAMAVNAAWLAAYGVIHGDPFVFIGTASFAWTSYLYARQAWRDDE